MSFFSKLCCLLSRCVCMGVCPQTFLALLFFMTGCSQSSQNYRTLTSRISTASNVTSARSLDLLSLKNQGGSGSSGLTSLQYYITGIQLCQDLTISGNTYSNPKNCIQLFSLAGGGDSRLLPPASGTPDYAAAMTVARSLTTGYVDLMNSSALTALEGRVTLLPSLKGTYRYGFVTWGYPIKVTGSVSIPQERGPFSIYTQDGTYSNITYNSVASGQTTATNLLSPTTATSAVVSLSSSGTWFALQTPLVVDATSDYILELVFNPDGLLRGHVPASTAAPSLTDTTASMTVPSLNLVPVPHTGAQSVVRESYLASIATGVSLRVDIYTISDPTNTSLTNSIYGVEGRTINTAGVLGNIADFADFPKIASVTGNATPTTGSVSFKDTSSNTLLSGFTRAAAVGGTTTATIGSCADVAIIPSCGSTVTFTRTN